MLEPRTRQPPLHLWQLLLTLFLMSASITTATTAITTTISPVSPVATVAMTSMMAAFAAKISAVTGRIIAGNHSGPPPLTILRIRQNRNNSNRAEKWNYPNQYYLRNSLSASQR
jgi:hypothetical protein